MSRNSEHVIAWRKRTKRKMIAAMGGCCQSCGYDRCHDALEFHHIDPAEKEFTFGKLRATPRAVATLIAELRKCVMLCSNCHKEVHAGIRAVPEAPPIDETALMGEAAMRRKMKSMVGERVITRREPKIKLTDSEVFDLYVNEFGRNALALARHLAVSETAIRKRIKAFR